MIDIDGRRVLPSSNEILYQGQTVKLPPKAMQVLVCLARHSQEVVPREQILDEVWSDAEVGEDVLTSAISVLRKSLGDTRRSAGLIETIPKRGYRMTVPARWTERRISEVDQGEFEEAASHSGLVRWEKLGLAKAWRKRPVTLVLAALAVTIAAVVGFLQATREPEVSAADGKRVVVLPFETLGEHADRESWGLGFRQELLSHLTRASRNTEALQNYVFFPGDPLDDGFLSGRTQDVDAYVVGDVRSFQGRVRVTSQIIDFRERRTLWAESFDGDESDLFRLETRVARRATAALVRRAHALRDSGEGAEDAESIALKHARRGYVYLTSLDYQSNENAYALFKKALDQDPVCALALAGQSEALARRHMRFGFDQRSLEESLRKSRRAIELQPNLPEGYRALSTALQAKRRFDEAIQALEMAVELKPDDYESMGRLGLMYLLSGRLDRTVELYEKLIRLRPGDPRVLSYLAKGQMLLEDNERAEQRLLEALDSEPLSSSANAFMVDLRMRQGRYEEAAKQCEVVLRALKGNQMCLGRRAEASMLAGDTEAAWRDFSRLSQSHPRDPYYKMRAAQFLVLKGQQGKAEELLRQAISIGTDRIDNSLSWSLNTYFVLASSHALLGRNDEAFQWLDRALEKGYSNYVWLLLEPAFEELRRDERFEQVVADMQSEVNQMRGRLGLAAIVN